MYYLFGAAIGLLCLLPFIKSPTRVLAMNGYVALAMMISVYLGAWLVTGGLEKFALESAIAIGALGLASVLRSKWPLGIGGMVMMHGAYDHFFGAASGVAGWYPPVCAGFDVVVGFGLILLMLKRGAKEKTG